MGSVSTTEEAFEQFVQALSPTSYKEVSDDGVALLELLSEPRGWTKFLTTLGKETFSKEFALYHKQFWDWYWKITHLRSTGQTLSKETLVFLAGWARGCGKSSNVEWACITEGAVGLEGYVLYVSLTQDSANKHVLDIRDRIEGENIAIPYPHLAEPKIGSHGNRYAWNQEFLVTKGGWAIRPVGLDVAVRGLRLGDLRPTLIVLDDIDKFNSSRQTVADSMQIISRSILPAGIETTIVLVAQNLIYADSIVNQIVTNKVDLLSDRITSVYPAFKPDTLSIDTVIDGETGKTQHKIVEGSVPYWKGMDVPACQRFLNNSGLEAFYSEYQHDFTLDMQDKVIPEYLDYPVHVIGWSQFEEKFKSKGIPLHWQVGMGLDIGYSSTHLSAWTWIAVASEDSGLPNAHFRYRGLTFENVQITEQAEKVLRALKRVDKYGKEVSELDQIMASKMSHEALGERKLLNYQFFFNFVACQSGKEDGVPQWRNLLRVDKHQPHPFHQDVQKDDGTWTLGRPNWFDVVADDQLTNPRDDAGLAIHRAQTWNWKRRKVSITSTGIQKDNPLKLEDDANDSTRMILKDSSLSAVPLSLKQRVDKKLRVNLREEGVKKSFGQEDYGQVLLAREMAIREIERNEEERQGQLLRMVKKAMAPELSPRFRNTKRKRSRLL